MPVKKSVHSYAVERLNCAQSVLKGFQDRKKVPEEMITNARSLGGGRADNGVCGALYAALSLVDDQATKKSLRASFVHAAGSDQCREIRAKKILSCRECVEAAARLLEKTDF